MLRGKVAREPNGESVIHLRKKATHFSQSSEPRTGLPQGDEGNSLKSETVLASAEWQLGKETENRSGHHYPSRLLRWFMQLGSEVAMQ